MNERERFQQALQAFRRASYDLLEAWVSLEDATGESPESSLYPFGHSFDEVAGEIAEWAEDLAPISKTR